ncbi:glutamate racemase [Rhodococcus rhodnii]|uniref:Glutamate racemase n=2 Tax=Rhodococcus rhodnii TaxID=38312 RepID=R7WJV6_9NOCA|nr:aspartate/glutamate racemase family protein [Rhodococcus rhodnii]EOM75587.1 glutamate racemase [Rhodococcus rhodnii LMG 5362]TXG91889.1 glutamate racemase [Rhodococcus rhodnii]
MIVALIDSGLGLLPTAAHLRKLRPDLDLLLATDPDGAPWGPKPARWVIDRVLGTVDACRDRGAEVIVLPCNTASVTALDHVRGHVGDDVPVIGTVPAIKPAAAECSSVAIWATAATTASRYQARLVETYAAGTSVASVACHGLADAVDRGDLPAIGSAVADAVSRTPHDVEGVVLGCTHYPLVADEIAAQLPRGVRLFDSSSAVAAQTVRRADEVSPPGTGNGTVTVLAGGRVAELPAAAARYDAGRVFTDR